MDGLPSLIGCYHYMTAKEYLLTHLYANISIFQVECARLSGQKLHLALDFRDTQDKI